MVGYSLKSHAKLNTWNSGIYLSFRKITFSLLHNLPKYHLSADLYITTIKHIFNDIKTTDFLILTSL